MEESSEKKVLKQLNCEGNHDDNFPQLATRFCKECKKFYCGDCIIDFHDNHIKSVKKFDEFIKLNEEEISKLTSKIKKQAELQCFVKINDENNSLFSLVDNKTNTITSKIEQLTQKVSMISKYENDLNEKIKDNFKIHNQKVIESACYHENELKKMEDEAENSLKILNGNNIIEKSKLVKDDLLDKLEKNFNKIVLEIENNDKMNSLNSAQYLEFINTNNHEEEVSLQIEKIVEEIDKISLKIENEIQRIQKFKIKEEKSNNSSSISSNNEPESRFLFTITPDNELFGYDLKKQTVVKSDLSNLSTILNLKSVPSGVKLVNLGDKALITGGFEKKLQTNLCFEISINDENLIKFSAFPPMKDYRAKHNILYLNEINTVFVCSGTSNLTSEFFNLNKKEWELGPNLSCIRSNATLAYFNTRFIYCFGGFDNQKSKYHQDYEYLDLNSLEKWVSVSLKLEGMSPFTCALGFIHISNNKIMLCGGYDGLEYKKEFFIVDEDENQQKLQITKSKQFLPEESIFLQNKFNYFAGKYYNFNIFSNLIIFDVSTFESKTVLDQSALQN